MAKKVYIGVETPIPEVIVEPYLESTGTQYIDTGFKPTNKTRIEMLVSGWTSNESSTAVFGTMSSSTDRYEIYITSSTVYRCYYYGNYKAVSGVSVSDKTVITFEYIIF